MHVHVFGHMQCYELASEGNLEEAYRQSKQAMHSAGKDLLQQLYICVDNVRTHANTIIHASL